MALNVSIRHISFQHKLKFSVNPYFLPQVCDVLCNLRNARRALTSRDASLDFSLNDNSIFFLLAPKSIQLFKVLNSGSKPSTEVVVSWSKPSGGDAIDRYYVAWYKQGGKAGEISVEHQSRKADYQYIITNLQSGTNYQVRVYAMNSGGNGLAQSAHITTGNYI